MENATKALMITAGVLIGVLILSLGVYLYYTLGGYMTTTQQKLEDNAKNKFNTQFLKYINMTEGKDEPDHEVTIQDVITAANLANQNNKQHGLTEEDAGGNTYYVTVNAKINGGPQITEHLENKNLTEILHIATNYASSNPEGNYTYKCKSEDVKISNTTGRVFEINFN